MNKRIRKALDDLFDAAQVKRLDGEGPFAIFSDLHLGNGGARDDFVLNASVLSSALKEYYSPGGWNLILNGDVEDLYKFPLDTIRDRWDDFYRILDGLQASGKLLKIIGNHDLALSAGDDRYPVFDAIRLETAPGPIFVFHGHQGSRLGHRFKSLSKGVVKYFAKPLGIRNYSISQDSKAKYRLERNIYAYSVKRRCLSIIGHTHRVLFESLSGIDQLRYLIEETCLKYPDLPENEREGARTAVRKMRRELDLQVKREGKRNYRMSLYNKNIVLPVLFNSGSVIGKHGVTGLEIADGVISLVRWWKDSPAAIPRRDVISAERLDRLFARIELLVD